MKDKKLDERLKFFVGKISYQDSRWKNQSYEKRRAKIYEALYNSDLT